MTRRMKEIGSPSHLSPIFAEFVLHVLIYCNGLQYVFKNKIY